MEGSGLWSVVHVYDVRSHQLKRPNFYEVIVKGPFTRAIFVAIFLILTYAI